MVVATVSSGSYDPPVVRSLPILVLSTAGCSAVVGSAEETDAQSTSVTGVVVVDRVVGDEAARAEASARFIRIRGAIDDSALKLVGAGLDLPPVGQCATRRDEVGARPVQLLDVGAVSIESFATGQRTILTSRQVPDVVDLVSGTMYSARIDESSVPSTSDVAVLVGGSAEVPAFSVRARTPDAPSSVRITALDASNAEITWATAQGGDAVYIDVGATRCSSSDEGHAVIPATDGDVVTVHRVRREALSIPGTDRTTWGGELRFDFARVVTFKH